VQRFGNGRDLVSHRRIRSLGGERTTWVERWAITVHHQVKQVTSASCKSEKWRSVDRTLGASGHVRSDASDHEKCSLVVLCCRPDTGGIVSGALEHRVRSILNRAKAIPVDH
jgi:hypothetical protein